MTTFWAIALTLYLAPSVVLLTALAFSIVEELFVHISREERE